MLKVVSHLSLPCLTIGPSASLSNQSHQHVFPWCKGIFYIFDIDLKQGIERQMDVQRKKEAELSVGVGSSRKGLGFHLLNIFINKAVSVFTKRIARLTNKRGELRTQDCTSYVSTVYLPSLKFLFEMSVEK